MTGVSAPDKVDMPVYMSASMSHMALVLSPTIDWSWLSVYAIVFSVYRRLHSVLTRPLMLHFSSRKFFKRSIQRSGIAMPSLQQVFCLFNVYLAALTWSILVVSIKLPLDNNFFEDTQHTECVSVFLTEC